MEWNSQKINSREGAKSSLEGGLTSEERAFLLEYNDRLDVLVAKLATRQDRPIASFLLQLFRPELWRILINLGRAEKLTDIGLTELGGGHTIGDPLLHTEYDRRAMVVQNALREFGSFIENVDSLDSQPDPNHNEAPTSR